MPDEYWAAVAKDAQKAEGLQIKKSVSLDNCSMRARARTLKRWDVHYEARKRGERILCMACMKPKPKDAFHVKKNGHAESHCRACVSDKTHKKKARKK